MFKRKKYVKFCPKCRSIEIEVANQSEFKILGDIGIPTVYKCKKCKFSSSLFPEIELKDVRTKKRIQRKN